MHRKGQDPLPLRCVIKYKRVLLFKREGETWMLELSKVSKKKSINLRALGVVKKNLSGWLIMAPSLLLFIFFIWEPLIESVRLSLYSAQGIRTVKFIGLQNYFDVFQHPDFMPAIQNTISYTLWSLLIGFVTPIILAIVINEMVHAKSLFRVGTYFPNVVPGLATVLMWGFILKPGRTGVLNIFLSKIGVAPMEWLSNQSLQYL